MIEMPDKKFLILLPGPPEEVEYIFKNYLMDFFKERFERRIKKTSIIRIAGFCETEAASRLKNIIETERHLEEGDIEFYFEPRMYGVDLIIEVWWDNELLVDEILHKTKSEVYSELGDDIFGEADDTIEAVVGRLLSKKRKTLSVAESCTGGLLSSSITDAPGSSIYFKQGIVTYSTTAKVKQLGINENLIKKSGPVSENVALEMAGAVKKISGSDYALSVTGYAGPAGGRKAAAGTGYIGLATPGSVKAVQVQYSGSRKKVKSKFVSTALQLLWRELKNK
jgi:nicotinamide-nucleotide amidase